MKGLLLLKSTLADMESKYGVHIFVKDMYSLMQTKPAFIDLLRHFTPMKTLTVCISKARCPHSVNAVRRSTPASAEK